MKNIDLRHGAYKVLLAEFEQHLQLLNYSDATVYTSKHSVKEYLFYLQENKISLQTVKDTTPYFDYLKHRSNQRRDGALSLAYLKKQGGSLKQFHRFLHRLQNQPLPVFPSFSKVKSTPRVLTKEEIQKLLKTCESNLLGRRNKAILALCYGCGLRRKEAASLQVEDVDLERSEVFIRKSKTKVQRHVPMSGSTQKIIEGYLFGSRELLLPSDKNEGTLLVSERGKPLSVYSLDYVIKQLSTKAKIHPSIGLHTLRHSIATHLLQGGMKLEDIALFLGHKSLDSTQIYTSITESKTKQS